MSNLTIKVEDSAVKKALDNLNPKGSAKAELAGARAAAAFLKPLVAKAAPRRTGTLSRNTYRGTAKREKPGAFVAVHGSVRHLIIGGFHPRGGSTFVPGRPYIDETADRYGSEALDIAEAAIAKALDL